MNSVHAVATQPAAGEGSVADLGIARLLEAAAALFAAPTASLVLAGETGGDEALRDLALHSLDLARDRPRVLAVEDLRHDARFTDHAAVTGGSGLRFCAVAPLPAGNGRGALCVVDRQPRAAAATQLAALAALADSLGTILTLRRQLSRLQRDLAKHEGDDGHLDALTGLPNRRILNERLDIVFSADAACGAVLLIDLDRLKEINDTLGHDAGDAVLREAGSRVRQSVPAGGLVARAGSDEFAVVLDGLSCREEAQDLARRVVDALAAQFDVGEQRTHSGACVGISFYPDDAANPWQLLRNADVALHEAKRQGRGAYRLYEPGMLSAMLHRKTIETELYRGLAADEFDVHFQPIVSMDGDPGITVEALLRWNRPQGGPQGPAGFLDIAEACGLILPLGRQVIRRATTVLADWRSRGLPIRRMAINLASSQLTDPTLLADLSSMLAEVGLEPADLELEITESVLFSDSFAVVERTLDRLTAAGFAIVLDDFGTGYASLVHLKQASVGALKIDRSFVQGLPEGGNDAEIVRAMIGLGRNLGLRIVAEGVETEAQLECLRRLGCNFFQGYFIARPAPEAEMARFMAQWPSRAAYYPQA